MDLLKWSQVKLSFEIGGDWDLRVVDSSSMLQLGPEKKYDLLFMYIFHLKNLDFLYFLSAAWL